MGLQKEVNVFRLGKFKLLGLTKTKMTSWYTVRGIQENEIARESVAVFQNFVWVKLARRVCVSITLLKEMIWIE